MTKKSILIFAKVPTIGLVKTRLSQTTLLSDYEVSLIAKAMLKDTIVIASRSKADFIEIGYYPEQSFYDLKKIVESIQEANDITIPIYYHLQQGSSFDERFKSVVQASIDNGNDLIVVLGADLPYMPFSLINSAFNYLITENKVDNVVIGPTGEGGIYLVGLSRNFTPNWFTKYNLFTNGVEIIQFTKFCKLEKIQLSLLTPLIDIDIEEDLVSLLAFIEGLKIAENNDNFHFPYYTVKVLESLGVYVKEIKGKTRKRKIGKFNLGDSIVS
ncbi:MAG: TIGR04282 family arsenosugar biosynthesis glycosyltransferase [Promethearchaeota archaeon]